MADSMSINTMEDTTNEAFTVLRIMAMDNSFGDAIALRVRQVTDVRERAFILPNRRIFRSIIRKKTS